MIFTSVSHEFEPDEGPVLVSVADVRLLVRPEHFVSLDFVNQSESESILGFARSRGIWLLECIDVSTSSPGANVSVANYVIPTYQYILAWMTLPAGVGLCS